ncbi:MAG: M56 family metallopeptidase [Anaerocolumna sp.]
MQNFIFALVTASLTMSMIAIIYMLITPMLSKRYTAKWRYYSWLIIIIGLIIPFRPQFESSFIQVEVPMTYSVRPQLMTPSEEVINAQTSSISNHFVRDQNKINSYQIITAIWIIGVIIMLLYHVYKHIRFLMMIKRWHEEIVDSQAIDLFHQLKNELGISSKIELQQCACITNPMMIGLSQPKILLPLIKYPYDELCLIFKHELTHFKRKDLWYKILVIIARIIHWFNPIIYWIAKEISVQCEISCDEAVIQNESIQVRKLYGQTILNAAKRGDRVHAILSTNFNGGKRYMKSRITSIMDIGRKKKGIIILSCLLAVGMTTGMVFAAADSNEKIGAYESGTPITKQEQAKLDNQKKQDTAEQYSIYEKFGLTYDSKKDSFSYDGKKVRFFIDTLDSEGNLNSFVRYDGTIDIKAIRNKQYVLTGIESASKEEYDKRTTTLESAMKNNNELTQENPSADYDSGSAIGSATEQYDGKDTSGISAANESGDLNYVDDSLNEYLNYGISYSKSSHQWFYKEKPIHYLTDGDIMTYVDNSNDSVKNGISLEVLRNGDGVIEKLVQISTIQ